MRSRGVSVNSQSRRQFLQTSTAAAAGSVMPYWFSSRPTLAQEAAKSPNERPVVGCIGTGSRWHAVGRHALNFADCVAVCDVDALHLDEARDIVKREQSKKGRDVAVAMYEDYRELLDRGDLDIVTIVTPDHWHSKIAIDAMRAGLDVYCEKPLTLTINEGKQIISVLNETQRVFQVGTQQRTEMGQRFLQAIAMIRDGRIGDVQKVTCDIGGAPTSGEIPVVDVPRGLNWDMWLGQAPMVDFRFKEGGRWGNSRCHYEFRWWYEYSGGKMTDWGAHHVDIAQWAIEQNGDGQGPVSVEPVSVEHPVPFENGYPTQPDQYNTATKFEVKVMFENGVEMRIVSNSSDGNGILFEGTKGRFHVSRGRMRGGPVEELESNPLPDGAVAEVYGGRKPTSHMENFIECVKTRSQPISDVWSHHRAMTTCHLSNIAMRLGRTLNWDPESEQIVGDSDAQQWQGREQRKGYEIDVPV
ncbi:Gfo/Idh/MocA family protein [Maioricimonas rarisocia]|uniref:Gfo/Idh/MocA family protein n=1 Tax=Maioricimonas rarisocia TaxID=2528026 RepID=UPI0018D21217